MSIDIASDTIREEHLRAGVRWRARDENASMLQSLQDLVEEVELRNMSSDREVPADMLRRVRLLARSVPVDPPRGLLRAGSTPRLHEALLRWQGSLLDRIAPHREAFTDRYD